MERAMDVRQESVARRFNIHVIAEGSGSFEANGQRYELTPGDVFAFFPEGHILGGSTPGTPWRYTWFALEGTRVRWAMRLAGLAPETPCLRGHHHEKLEPLFRKIEHAFRNDDYPPLFPVTTAWQVLDQLASGVTSEGRHEPLDLAEAARFLMDHEHASSLTVAALARRLGVTRCTLFRRFRAAYGTSPKRYLDELRLDQARCLLLHTRSSMKEVAAACGFTSAHYFSRAFRRRYGRPPKEWQARRRTF
jgi:AraC-like DNA-binding protein